MLKRRVSDAFYMHYALMLADTPAPERSDTAQRPLSQTESASPGGPHGAWLVQYEIGGQQLTDYWFYVGRRWVFDLPLSNPASVKLYRMSPQQYVAALGCAR